MAVAHASFKAQATLDFHLRMGFVRREEQCCAADGAIAKGAAMGSRKGPFGRGLGRISIPLAAYYGK